MKKNIERMHKRSLYKKSADMDEVRDLYYSLRDAILLNNQYIRLSRERNVDQGHVEDLIRKQRYVIYGIIDDLIAAGGTSQTNAMAIRFLEDDIENYYKNRKDGKGISKRYQATERIRKLKEDAVLL